MAAKASLKEIVDALEGQSEGFSTYLNLDTGEVVAVSLDLLLQAEKSDEMPHLPEWQKPAWVEARQVLTTDRFEQLPSQREIHEWSIMENFVDSLSPGKVRDELDDAIHGSGAFRSFKSAIRRHGIEQSWYQFREKALEEIARDWCEEHQIPFE